MILLRAAILRESVSLLKFLFHSHAQVFSCEISTATWYIHTFFFFPYCFFVILIIIMLSVLFLVAVISLFCSFFRCLRVRVLMHPSFLQCWWVFLLPIFYTYSLSMLSLGCRAVCIVIIFFDFWSICWSSSTYIWRTVPRISHGICPSYLFGW